MNTRRSLLSTVAIGTPLIALAGCGALTPSQVAQDAQLIATAISNEVTAAEALVPSQAAILTTINGYATTISADAAKLGSVVVSITGSPQQIVQEIVTDAQAVIPLLIPFFPAAAPALGILDAALALLPALLQGVGLTVPAATAKASRLTPDQARLVLARVKH